MNWNMKGVNTMLYDIITMNKDTNAFDVIRYFISLDKTKISTLYSRLMLNPNDNVEILSKMDALLNQDFRPIYYILNKDEINDEDRLLKDCVIINIEKITPVDAIPGARKLMEDCNKTLNKPVVTTEEKELLYEPIINDNKELDDSLINNVNKRLVKSLVPKTNE